MQIVFFQRLPPLSQVMQLWIGLAYLVQLNPYQTNSRLTIIKFEKEYSAHVTAMKFIEYKQLV